MCFCILRSPPRWSTLQHGNAISLPKCMAFIYRSVALLWRRRCLYRNVFSFGTEARSIMLTSSILTIEAVNISVSTTRPWWWLADFGMSLPTGIGANSRLVCYHISSLWTCFPALGVTCAVCRTLRVCLSILCHGDMELTTRITQSQAI